MTAAADPSAPAATTVLYGDGVTAETPRAMRADDGGMSGRRPDGEPFAAVVETHTSVILMLGDRTYKVKRPVDLPFLDLSTLAARMANCRREFELNARIAPDVYLGVVQLRDLIGETGLDGEPAVVMRRMPTSRRLTNLLAAPEQRGEARRCVEGVADLVARFHASLTPVAGYGLAGTMARLWREGHEQTERFTGALLDHETWDETYRLAEEYLAGRTELLSARESDGLVRDGHGDLLTDDVYLLDDGVRVLDCLEFADDLRLGDVLMDIAFLMMDLTLHGAPELSRVLVDRYRQLDAESHPRSLEHHYVAYRAWVRAKVECLRHETGDPGAHRRAQAALDLCRREARAARVHLVPVGGLPGSGKSTVARAIIDRDERDWVLLSSDEIRKELAGLRPTTDAAAPFGQGIYDPAHTAATYAELLRRAGTALARGVNVLLDASWTDAQQRAQVELLAAEHAAAATPLVCTAPLDVCRERMTGRRSRPHVSDADYDVLRRMAEGHTAWAAATIVDTTATAADAAGQVLRVLDERPCLPRKG